MSLDDDETMVEHGELNEFSWGALAALGRAFHVADPSLQATLQAILTVAADTIDGVDFAGVNLLRGDAFEPQAVLGAPPLELDALQQQTGVGPCIDSARDQRVIRVDDMADAVNWPDYGVLAESLGVRSMLCLPMWVDRVRLGSISLYSTTLAAFDERAEQLGALLAAHASIALSEAQRLENLAAALHNRDLIGQAKGILMERFRITSDAAFDLLSKASQRSNRKLSVIAEEVAATGALGA